MNDRQVAFKLKDWMKYAALSAVLFIVSYFMAATMPSCETCRAGDANALQIFHFVFMAAAGFGSIGTAVVAIVEF